MGSDEVFHSDIALSEPYKSPSYEPYKSPSYEPYESPSYEPPSYDPYYSSMDEFSCSAVRVGEDFSNYCKLSNGTYGACLKNHSISPLQTDLDVQKNELLAWVLKNPKGINKSIDQPSTSYMAKGEKEKKIQKDDY